MTRIDLSVTDTLAHPKKFRFRCDVCGQFVPLADLVSQKARRRLLTPDSPFTRETYETLCAEHAHASH